MKRGKFTCGWKNCDRPVAVLKSGLCNMHYLRQKRGKDMDAPPQRVRNSNTGIPCRVEGCNRQRTSSYHGLCGAHYHRSKRHG